MSIVLLVLFFAFASSVFAQQPPPLSPQEQADRFALELAYVEREHKMCRSSLADIWLRANVLEKQVQDLTVKLKAMEETKGEPAKKK